MICGCANQAGDDSRNVAQMAALPAGPPLEAPGVTVDRLCGSGPDAAGGAACAIRAGEVRLVTAGGVDAVPEIAENGASWFGIERETRRTAWHCARGATRSRRERRIEIAPVTIRGHRARPSS